LVQLVKKIFRGRKVIHQGSPAWLGRQRFDIYIPSRKLAIEYQGAQHFRPVEFFGGEEGFAKTVERDRRKLALATKNGVSVEYFRFDEKITLASVKRRLARYLSQE